jgi:hypothetical protein
VALSFFTADQLFAHAVGDYFLQGDWMANEKTKRNVAALAHVTTYVLPFLLLSPSSLALAVIAGTHFIIDRWRLARYVVLAKNLFLRPNSAETEGEPLDWWDTATGSPKSRPAFLSVWLLIIVDNLMHVAINAAALRWL